jgi:hypothetical protein
LQLDVQSTEEQALNNILSIFPKMDTKCVVGEKVSVFGEKVEEWLNNTNFNNLQNA